MNSATINFSEFQNKKILITGASTGIGAELAKAFAKQGAIVGLHYLSSADAANHVASQILGEGGRVELIKADASEPQALAVAVNEAAERLGGLNGLINNIQVSWTKLGIERASQMLSRGVNDLGGTLMNESISRSAGSQHGQEVTAFELCKVIRSVGRVPVRRNTNYEILEIFQNHDPEDVTPLVSRKGHDPLSFLDMFPEVSK